MSTAKVLAPLFLRDLSRLAKQIEGFPSDEALWQTAPGIPNAAGNLALHLEGNLSEFIGRQLGGKDYARNRPLEFGARGLSRADLGLRVGELLQTIPAVVDSLSAEQMESRYPEDVLGRPMSTQEFLIHLYGHLNWHLGQIDSLRRLLAAEAASPGA